MKHLILTILAASALVAIAGTAIAGDTVKDIQVEITLDRSAPITETYKSIEIEIGKACRKANLKTTRSYKTRAVFNCQKALMEKAVQAFKMPTLLAYHNVQIGRG